MKKIYFLYLLLLSAKCFPQTADSSYYYQQSNNNIVLSQRNATFLLASPIQKTGFTKLYANSINGGFRTAQQAQRTMSAGVYSEGISKFKRFLTTGYFSFHRTWQDSLAWSTKGLEIDDQPYYYGSVKAGAFERMNYSLGGLMSYALIKNKLYLGTGVAYTYNEATRSVDPRPEVNTYQLNVKPELVYSFGKQLIGLSAHWGYGSETMAIAFKNKDFQNSTLGYPERVNYLIQGYGLITNSQGTSTPLKRLDKYFGVGLNYHGSFGNYRFKSMINYLNTQEDNYQDLSQSVKRAYLSYYDTDQITALVQLDKSSLNASQQLALSYTNQNSNDINVIFYAINYRYLMHALNLKYLYQFNIEKPFSPEFGIISNYRKVEKSDYSTAHYMNYDRLETELLANSYLQLSKMEKLSLGLSIGYRKPLNNHISIPVSQQTVFTRGVVFPDFSYYSSAAYKLSGQVNFISGAIFKQFRTGIAAKAVYYHQTGTLKQFPTATSQVGRQLFDANLALNLYF